MPMEYLWNARLTYMFQWYSLMAMSVFHLAFLQFHLVSSATYLAAGQVSTWAQSLPRAHN